jgi:DNA-binding transcriptional ArsR family regulator
LRLQGVVSIADAPMRLEIQVDCHLVLLYCARSGPAMERLLVQMETLTRLGKMALILVSDLDSVDLAFTALRHRRTQLLCDPDATDLAAALVAAIASLRPVSTVHEPGRESEGTHLQQLSEEVGRIARTLEALTGGHRHTQPSLLPMSRISDRSGGYRGMPPLPPIGGLVDESQKRDLTAGQVRDLLRVRRLRSEFLPVDLFADPAWDMLLDLMAARLDHERVSVSSLCIAAAVPPTTALRWIRTLTDQGLVIRQADPHDGRRIFIALSDEAAGGLSQWFAASRRFLKDAAG